MAKSSEGSKILAERDLNLRRRLASGESPHVNSYKMHIALVPCIQSDQSAPDTIPVPREYSI